MEENLNLKGTDCDILGYAVLSKEKKDKKIKMFKEAKELYLTDIYQLIKIQSVESQRKATESVATERLDLSHLFNSEDITDWKKLKLIQKMCENSDVLILRLILSKILINDKKLFPLSKDDEKMITTHLAQVVVPPSLSELTVFKPLVIQNPLIEKVDFPSELPDFPSNDYFLPKSQVATKVTSQLWQAPPVPNIISHAINIAPFNFALPSKFPEKILKKANQSDMQTKPDDELSQLDASDQSKSKTVLPTFFFPLTSHPSFNPESSALKRLYTLIPSKELREEIYNSTLEDKEYEAALVEEYLNPQYK